MTSPAETDLGIAPRTLVITFLLVAGLFTGITLLSGWFRNEEVQRSRRMFEAGQALAQKGQITQAIDLYRNALEAGGSNSLYRLQLARALMKANRLGEAEVYLNEVLNADPADAEANVLLGRIAAKQGRTATALDYYHRAVFGYWRTNAEQNRLEAHWELIDLLRKIGARKQVVAELLQIPDQAPNDTAAQERAARLLLEYGFAAQARDIYRDVLRMSPKDAEARAGFGQAELALGQDAEAERAFRRALRQDPNSTVARQGLDLITETAALDPTMHGLSVKERYSRTQVLVERTSAALERCAGAQPTGPVAQVLAAAQEALHPKRRPRNLGQATEDNLGLAEEAWALAAACAPAEPALARVLAKVGR